MLTVEQLTFIAESVIEGGKALHTGPAGFLKAEQALNMIRAEINAQQLGAIAAEKMAKPNGAAHDLDSLAGAEFPR